jgi:uncharacterized phage infection (PIP) family protein YhgE
MKDEKKKELFEEGLKKFNYRVGYKINESPTYRPLVGMDEVFDEVPMTEAGDQEDAPKAGGGEVPPAPSNDEPIQAEPPVPEFDNSPEQPDDTETPSGEPQPMDLPPQEPVDAGQEVDEIQNEIIKHNIEAMKNITNQLDSLNSMTQALNAKLDELGGEVEEVREPTNTEQLMSKKDVSYPYYFGLNDMWTDNWFDEQRKDDSSKGIRKLPDGSFVADFDDLPKQSKHDVQDSFNEIG